MYQEFISERMEKSLLRSQIEDLEANVSALNQEIDEIIYANRSGYLVLKISEDREFRQKLAHNAISIYNTSLIKWSYVNLIQNSISSEYQEGFEWVCLDEIFIPLDSQLDNPLDTYDYLDTSINWKNWASWLDEDLKIKIETQYQLEKQINVKPLTSVVSPDTFNVFFEWWKNSELGNDIREEEEFQYAQAVEIALEHIKSRVYKKIL
jgi:hypothetical protein